MHAAGSSQVKSMGRSRTHRDARSHYANARERCRVAIDTSSGGDKVVDIWRSQTPQRDIVNVIRIERLPHVAFDVVMLFQGPRGTGDTILELHAGAHFVHGQMMTSDDPARLPNTRQSIGADAGFCKCAGSSDVII